MPARRIFLTALGLLSASLSAVGAEETRWWPVQALPKVIVRSVSWHQLGTGNLMMLHSLAGLAAQAVNEHRGDEMLWISTDYVDVEDWLDRLLRSHREIQQQGEREPWDLVDRFKKAGIIKGYILYRRDDSPGERYQQRPGIDCSVNVATSLAGLLGGIIVDEKLEKKAKSHGLTMLIDVRDKTQQWCFDTYKDQFNRHMLCQQDPRVAIIRDVAIAHKAFTVYGLEEPVPAALRWLAPPSPILGYMAPEAKATRLASVWGHFQTGTNYCWNLSVLMAGSDHDFAPPAKPFDPRTIDFNDRRSGVSFVSTDGDNVCWYEVGFFHKNPGYWRSPDRGRIPFGWSCCFCELAQLFPQAMQYAAETQSDNDWFVEWGGGYFYPDLFASERPDRWEVLARQSRLTWELMKKSGTRIIGFNIFVSYDSPDAHKAYEVIAHEMDDLHAILIRQYNPYEAGAGKIFWVKNRSGLEIPVITCCYSIWENHNKRPRSGTPAKIAREIRETVAATPAAELPRYDWVACHVWSFFRHAPGNDEDAENLPKTPRQSFPERKKDAPRRGGISGYTPVTWCVERLPESICVVCPEELVWRIRMKHDPEQTRKLIEEFPTDDRSF
jgi:hypothetical protein